MPCLRNSARSRRKPRRISTRSAVVAKRSHSSTHEQGYGEISWGSFGSPKCGGTTEFESKAGIGICSKASAKRSIENRLSKADAALEFDRSNCFEFSDQRQSAL